MRFARLDISPRAGSPSGLRARSAALARSWTAEHRTPAQNHAIGTMREARGVPTLACMFQRTPTSSPVAEPPFRADVSKAAGLRVGHLDAWPDVAGREARAYLAWCAAGRRDRDQRYAMFLEAPRREEVAARQVEHDVSALGAPDPAT